MSDLQTKHKTTSNEKLRHSFLMESFEKNLEFPADGPGRVIVRLERLMGSDKIRITDIKYMATLLQRLEEEEERTWLKRTRERRKAEHNRFRQLAIDGYTEPGPEMQDLYHHPVFRVNRILNRLSKLDNNIGPILSLPPIIPIDPFKHDDSGKAFKSYPGHLSLMSGTEYYTDTDKDDIDILENLKYTDQHEKGEEDVDKKNIDMESGEEDGDENISKIPSNLALEGDQSGESKMDENTDAPRMLTLQEIQKKYGVATNTDLGVQWRPYQSGTVDMMFYDEEKGVWDLYELGGEIAGVYDRQQETTEEYLSALRGGRAPAFFKKRKDRLRKEGKADGEEEEDEDDEIDRPPPTTNSKSRGVRSTPSVKVQESKKSTSIVESEPAKGQERGK